MDSPEGREGFFHIFVVSDATGQTAENVTLAALSQFERKRVMITRFPQVRSAPQVQELVDAAARNRGMIVYTLVSEELRHLLEQQAREQGVPTVDLIGPMLSCLAASLGNTPKFQPGLSHRIDDLYLRRMEAIDFTVKHDDGQNLRTVGEADIVLVGVSRTTKTPLSIYLATEGYKVANIPLMLRIPPPQILFHLDRRKVVGLYLDPKKLVEIRRARLRHLRAGEIPFYADPAFVLEEIEYARSLFRRHGWYQVNVTDRAVEEVARDILSRIYGKDREVL